MADKVFTLVLAGHVDHGKSTLTARLLHAAGRIAEEKITSVTEMCARRGMPFEWSFMLDSLQAERDQGITIDITQAWFATRARRYCLIDAPGHREFLRNLFTGAAHADAALLVVDAVDGVLTSTRRHAQLLALLGIRNIVVAVNKMDAAGYSEARFAQLQKEVEALAAVHGLALAATVPVSAREGEGIASPSPQMQWYSGPCVIEALDALPPQDERAGALRFMVQDVYKFDERRIVAGRVESGVLRVGDALLFSPGGAEARVASFEAWPDGTAPKSAQAGEVIGITLTEPVFVERGHVASAPTTPPMLTNLFRARVFWMGEHPLVKEQRCQIRIGTAEVSAEVREVEGVIDSDTLAKQAADAVPRYGVADVVFRPRGLVAVDAFAELPATGRIVILQDHNIAGAGIVDLTGFSDQRVARGKVKSAHITPYTLNVTEAQRTMRNGHLGGILWFTGLSGAGKTTLAQALQEKLFERGYQVFVLDGDNVRKGLNRDLGFSAAERQENLRRAGEVAALFAQAGFIVITAFISPTHADRILARAAAPEAFHSVYVRSDVETCERRDVKGLYRKARAGEIDQFTGITAPYEEPTNPDLVIDTRVSDIDTCVSRLLRYIERQFIEPVAAMKADGEFNAGAGI